MRIGTVIYPLLAVCLSAYGGYRALLGRFRFVRRMGGRARTSYGHMYFNHACRSYHYMLGRVKGGSVRRFFDMSEVLVPSAVPPVYVTGLAVGIAEQYKRMLGGWELILCNNVPGFARYLSGRDFNGDAIWQVNPEYSFGTYCKEYGVPYSKLKGAMDDVRGQLYMKLVEEGYLKDDDVW